MHKEIGFSGMFSEGLDEDERTTFTSPQAHTRNPCNGCDGVLSLHRNHVRTTITGHEGPDICPMNAKFLELTKKAQEDRKYSFSQVTL